MVSCYQKPERTFPLLPSPLVCTCCPSRCDCLGACRVAICFSQSTHHILSLVIFFPSQKERRILISHSLGSICRSLSWSTGKVHSLPGTWVAGWSCRVKYWQNLIWPRLPIIKLKSQIFLLYGSKEVMRSLNSSFPNSSKYGHPQSSRQCGKWTCYLCGTSSWALVTHCKHTIYSGIQEHTYHQPHVHFWRWLFLKE